MPRLSLTKLIPSCFGGVAKNKSSKKSTPEGISEAKPKGILKKPNEVLKSPEKAGTSAHVPGQASPISLQSNRVRIGQGKRVRIDEGRNEERQIVKSEGELKADAKAAEAKAKAKAKEQASAERAERARIKAMEKAYADEVRWF